MKLSASFIFHQMRMNPIKNIYISIPSLHYLPPTEKPSPQESLLLAPFPAPLPSSQTALAAFLLPSSPDLSNLGRKHAGTGRSPPRGGHQATSASSTTKQPPPLVRSSHGATASPHQGSHVQPPKHLSPSIVAKKRKIKKILAGIAIPRTRRAFLPTMAPAWGSPHRATGLGDRAGDTHPRGDSPGRAGLHCYRGNTRSVQRVKHSIRLLIEPPSNSITSENGFFNATISCF